MRRTGKILYYGRKGFGHIADDDSGEHIYFHIQDFCDKRRSTVEQDELVTYELVHTPKGMRCIKLELATKTLTTENHSEPIKS
jgi:cold shock CspA family protein